MMRWLILCGALLFSTTPVSAEVISKIAVVVNDEIITTYEIEREVEKATASSGTTPTGEQKDKLREGVRDQLIEQALIRQRIAELGLKVKDDELERAIQEIQAQNKLNREQLQEALRNEGVGWNQYLSQVRNQLLNLRLMQREVYSKVEVTNIEARQYYESQLDTYRLPATVDLKRLTFPVPTGADRMGVVEVRKKALDAQQALREGQPFADILSSIESAGNGSGGEMGAVEVNSLNAQFAAVVSELEEGDVSDLIEVGSAIHLLQLEKRVVGKVREFDEVKPAIREQLLSEKRETKAKTYVDDLRQKAFVDIRD